MPRGGTRPGAGRKSGSGRWGEATQVVRLPVSRVTTVTDWLQAPPLGAELADLRPARPGQPRSRPLFASRVPAGFPSPAEEYVEGPLDLNDYLIRHEAATFYVRVAGQSMTGAGILDGDVLVVDRAREPRPRDIVLAVIDNELTVKELDCQGPTPVLRAHHPDYAPIVLAAEQELLIWGVVTGVVRKLP
jgi:DNA polymerase V